MDWIGIVIFALFIAFKAMSESNKQKKQREARQQSSSPMPRKTPPVAMPDWNFPPVFPFFEEEEEAPKPVVKTEQIKKEVFIEEKPIERPRTAETPIETLRPSRPTVREVKALTQENRGGFGLEQARMGIIWSEILSSPRALRPYRSRGYRG